MGRRIKRVRYELNSGEIENLSFEEIKAILRATDELIASGGRNLLSKILKGSKEKKVLELQLDKCPVYGYYKELKIQEIMYRVDWMILKDYIRIEYSGRIPLLVYSERGWEIERETFADELFGKLKSLLGTRDYSQVNELKDRNRGMILVLLDKIKDSENARFIPLLKEWESIEYKKVQAKIRLVINHLKKAGQIL